VDNINVDVHGNAVGSRTSASARALTGHTHARPAPTWSSGRPSISRPSRRAPNARRTRRHLFVRPSPLSIHHRAPSLRGDDWYEIARQHVEESPPPPRPVSTPTSRTSSSSYCFVASRSIRDDRPTTGEELSDELSAILDGRPVGIERSFAYPDGLTVVGANGHRVRWIRDHPTSEKSVSWCPCCRCSPR